jgi:hypothetical protein
MNWKLLTLQVQVKLTTCSTHKLSLFPLKPFLFKTSSKSGDSKGVWNKTQFRDTFAPDPVNRKKQGMHMNFWQSLLKLSFFFW